jgi:dephospho-CoA kinase
MLVALGATVIDADEVAREVTAAGSAGLAAIVAAFGPEMLTSAGELDRPRLGALVFADEGGRRRLNAIVHPRIAEGVNRRVATLRARGLPQVVYEAPLLVENGLHRTLDGLIVVHTPEEVQVRRVVQRDGLTEEQARLRLAAQLPLAAKVAVADYLIDGAVSLDQTREQVAAVWRDIVGGGPPREGRP